MDAPTILRHLLRAPAAYRTLLSPALRPQSRNYALLAPSLSLHHARYLSMPRVLTPSFWNSMIPRPLRPGESVSASASASPADISTQQPKEWNPATWYIILGMLVGSQAIQILWLKQERTRDLRRAEAKMGILREVIERVQRGEDVDVEKVLGTGVEGEEREWASVLKDIEEEEALFESRKKRRAARQAAAEKEAESIAEPEVGEQEVLEDGKVKVETIDGAKFY